MRKQNNFVWLNVGISIGVILTALFLMFSAPSAHGGEPFVVGQLGIGAYSTQLGRPEIDTVNPLGLVAVGGGYEFSNGVAVMGIFEHWSSLETYPGSLNVFNSPHEEGRGFNAFWLKAEKRWYPWR